MVKKLSHTECESLKKWPAVLKLYVYCKLYIYIPRAPMTSIFEGQPPKARPNSNQNQDHLGSRYVYIHIYIYIDIFTYIHILEYIFEKLHSDILKFRNFGSFPTGDGPIPYS